MARRCPEFYSAQNPQTQLTLHTQLLEIITDDHTTESWSAIDLPSFIHLDDRYQNQTGKLELGRRDKEADCRLNAEPGLPKTSRAMDIHQ